MKNPEATPEMMQQAAADALSTLRILGREDLIPFITIEWMAKFTSRMGDACYLWLGEAEGAWATIAARGRCSAKYRRLAAPNNGEAICRVRFSSVLWPRATEKERKDTVVHEICHLVANHEARLANRARPSAHGREWKSVMYRAGVRPERCHHVDTTGLRRSSNRVTVYCSCGEHEITTARATKMRRGHFYSCRKCGTFLAFSPEEVEATTRRVENLMIARRLMARGR